MSTRNSVYLSITICLSLIAVMGFLYLSQTVYFADSEIWLLTLSQNIFNYQQLTSIVYKIGFHGVTFLFSHYAPSELDVYYHARLGWAVLAITAQFVLALFMVSVTQKKHLLFPLFLSLILFSAFFNQGFRIRGDAMALLIHSSILLFIWTKRTITPTKWDFVILSALNALLLSSTPKAIYFYLTQFIFSLSIYRHLRLHKQFLSWIWKSYLIPILFLLSLLLISYFLPSRFSIINPLLEALDYYLKSFDPTLFNIEWLTSGDFQHLYKAFILSPIHLILFAAGAVLYAKSSFDHNKLPIFSSLNIYFGSSFFFFIFHNQKLPFFIGSFASPLLAYTIILIFTYLQERMTRKSDFVIFICSVVMSIFGCLQFLNNIKGNNNFSQAAAIKKFDKYITQHPETSHYDIIGILPRKTKIFLFIGPGETSRKQEIIDKLTALNPDVILFTYKFIFLEPTIQNYLLQTRVPIEPHVWVKGDYFSVTNQMQYFNRAKRIGEKHYWIIPHAPRSHIYNLIDHKLINSSVIYLDNEKPTTREQANQFAIPTEYLAIIQTDITSPQFDSSPYQLFRYDTDF